MVIFNVATLFLHYKFKSINNTTKERLFFLICFLCISLMLKAADKPVIKISTENVDLIYRVGDNGRLYQSYLGKKLNHATDIAHLPQGTEAYLTHGLEDYFEPAIHIVHNDGNPSTLLKYVSHAQNQVSPGVSEVVIILILSSVCSFSGDSHRYSRLRLCVPMLLPGTRMPV